MRNLQRIRLEVLELPSQEHELVELPAVVATLAAVRSLWQGVDLASLLVEGLKHGEVELDRVDGD